MKNIFLTTIIIFIPTLVQSSGLLEVLSPPGTSLSKMENFQHSRIPRDQGYQVGQSLIGHLHFLSEFKDDENFDPCFPLPTEFADRIASVERNPND